MQSKSVPLIAMAFLMFGGSLAMFMFLGSPSPDQMHRPAPAQVVATVPIPAPAPGALPQQQGVAPSTGAPAPAPLPSERAPSRSPAELAQQRARILAAAQARERAAPAPAPAPPTGEGLTNRTGTERPELHAELNRDFMPLADECIEQARARDPELSGMLTVGFEIVVDEEFGAVIEGVIFPESNELAEAELLDCVDASLMSMLLPPGSADGREALELSMPIGDAE